MAHLHSPGRNLLIDRPRLGLRKREEKAALTKGLWTLKEQDLVLTTATQANSRNFIAKCTWLIQCLLL